MKEEERNEAIKSKDNKLANSFLGFNKKKIR